MSWQVISLPLTSIIQKYNLDISIVEIRNLWVWQRLDSDFYKPEHLAIERLTKNNHFCSFKDLDIRVDASAFYPSIEPRYNTGSLPFLRVANVDLSIKYNEAVTIPEELPNEYVTIKVGQSWDIIITKWWSVARCGILDRKCALSRDLILVLSSHLSLVQQKALFVYLITNTSNKLLLKTASLTAQPHLTLKLIQEHPIFSPKWDFQEKIAGLFDEYTSQRELSKSLYAEAEQVLLSELGLIGWIPTEVGITEKMSEEVKLFGRCDAEFFQPKYDELFGRLAKFQTQKLGDIVDYQKWVEPWADAYSESGIPFIRVADVSIEGIDTIEKNISTALLAEYGERYSPKKDEILFTKDGTIGISFVVNEDMRAVLSGAFLRLQKKVNIESEYLALVLNSIVSKMQIERFSGWAIIAHLKPSDAMEILIPILSLDIQSLISEKITTSHTAREKSKTLLERAKRAVEIFIEEDENSAESFLDIL